MSNALTWPNIKICGLRDEATILAMNDLPITEVGLVFAKSKRQVTVEQGEKLAGAIKKLTTRNNMAPRVAGVFVDLELERMYELLQTVPLDIVQLHGQEPLSYYEKLKEKYPHISIWKVVSIKPKQPNEFKLTTPLSRKELAPYTPYIDAVLLDAPGGGTGKPFNWKAITTFREVADKFNKKLVVAGGLNEDNVGELLSQYSVDGVDVSSGVETDGMKDINKIKQFVRRVIEA